jgi:beta-1,2-mannobiose phosphorylase / 1,2-beta-oligomannan phosphorylase
VTKRLSTSLLVQPSDISPSQVGWEVVGVLNPAVTIVGDVLVMMARVAQRPLEQRVGLTPLPRWGDRGRVTVDWLADHALCEVDARVVSMKENGDLRLTSVSHFQILRRSSTSTGPWMAFDVILPETSYEEFGIEDPRITKIADTYWITYVAVSRLGALTALMSSLDMVSFKRHGIIFPCENKDVVLFPQKVNGEYVALHRPNPNSHFSPPQIWLAYSPDLIHWGRHRPLLCGCEDWEGDRVGTGAPPILVDEGWLLLYHGSESSDVAGTVGRYAAGAVLLDQADPARVIARSSQPIMTPTADFETRGFVPNVVFPTAMIDQDDRLQVFYGAADTCIAMAEFSKRTVLDSMTKEGSRKL